MHLDALDGADLPATESRLASGRDHLYMMAHPHQAPPHLEGTSSSTLIRRREVLVDIGHTHAAVPSATQSTTYRIISSVISG